MQEDSVGVERPMSYKVCMERSFCEVWALEFECLKASEEAVIVDVHSEPTQLQGSLKDQG